MPRNVLGAGFGVSNHVTMHGNTVIQWWYFGPINIKHFSRRCSAAIVCGINKATSVKSFQTNFCIVSKTLRAGTSEKRCADSSCVVASFGVDIEKMCGFQMYIPKAPENEQRATAPERMIPCSGQIIATSAKVTPHGGLVWESPQNPRNSGLGIIYSNLPRLLVESTFFPFGMVT